MRDDKFDGHIFLFALALGMLIFFSQSPVLSHVLEPKSDYLSLYYAEAPFGVLYADVSGSSDCNFLWSSGQVSTSLGEGYVVKFWVGEELLSMTLEASETPIVVDGSFRLETRVEQYQRYCSIHMPWVDYSFENVTHSGKVHRYRLHLPNLPENVSSVDWGFAG